MGRRTGGTGMRAGKKGAFLQSHGYRSLSVVRQNLKPPAAPITGYIMTPTEAPLSQSSRRDTADCHLRRTPIAPTHHPHLLHHHHHHHRKPSPLPNPHPSHCTTDTRVGPPRLLHVTRACASALRGSKGKHWHSLGWSPDYRLKKYRFKIGLLYSRPIYL